MCGAPNGLLFAAHLEESAVVCTQFVFWGRRRLRHSALSSCSQVVEDRDLRDRLPVADSAEVSRK